MQALCGLKTMSKWFKRTLIGLASVVLITATLIGAMYFSIWHGNNFKSQVQVLEIPDENIQFILLTDISGFGDQAWYVYQLPIGVSLTEQMKSGHDREGSLFWNYSEAGDHSDSPKIEVQNDQYLVFSRGGLYHSLYNYRRAKVIVNDESPWHSYMMSEETNNSSGNQELSEEMHRGMEAWVRKNLHSKIEEILNNGT